MNATDTAWSDYWQAGNRHSCFAGDVPLAVAPLWTSLLNDLPSPLAADSAIMDAGCGGGALSEFLQQRFPDCRIHGIDAATGLPDIPGVTVHAGTRLESLPFADKTFHLVASQFGLEYADLTLAVPELVRVLAPKGALMAVLHHHSSVVVQRAAGEHASLEALMAEAGLIEKLSHLVTAEDRKAADRRAVEAAVATAFQHETQQPLTQTRRWVLDYIAELMETRQQQRTDYLRINLKRLVAELVGSRARLSAMMAAVLDEPAVLQLQEQLLDAGMRIHRCAVCTDDAEATLGWFLSAERADVERR